MAGTTMSRVVFLDTETTGLDADCHQVWEVAAITEDGQEHVWLLDRISLAAADPIALSISGFHDRHPHGYAYEGQAETTNHLQFALDFTRLTHGAHLVGAVVSFDEERIRRLLLERGFVPSWHYHLIDVEALAVGYLNGLAAYSIDWRRNLRSLGGLPWRSDDLSRMCGVEAPSDDERHTALGDARWAKRLYEAITGGAS